MQDQEVEEWSPVTMNEIENKNNDQYQNHNQNDNEDQISDQNFDNSPEFDLN